MVSVGTVDFRFIYGLRNKIIAQGGEVPQTINNTLKQINKKFNELGEVRTGPEEVRTGPEEVSATALETEPTLP